MGGTVQNVVEQAFSILFAKAKSLTIYVQRGKNPTYELKWSGIQNKKSVTTSTVPPKFQDKLER